MIWARYVVRMGEKKSACTSMLAMGELERKRPLGTPILRCVDNIKFDLK
jgi:hypothetical protein